MKLTKTCARFLRKHGGTLLAIGASVGVVLTAIETGKATIKAEKLVELNKDVTLPIRTYEYIYDTISGELTSQRGSRIRFQNLKQNGHI